MTFLPLLPSEELSRFLRAKGWEPRDLKLPLEREEELRTESWLRATEEMFRDIREFLRRTTTDLAVAGILS